MPAICSATVHAGTPIQYLCCSDTFEDGHCNNPVCPNRVGVVKTHGPLVQELTPNVVAEMVAESHPEPVRGGQYPSDFGMGENAAPVESHLQDDGRVKNGTYTLVSEKSGEHWTLRISTVQNKRSGLHGRRILSMLIGPNNEADYIGFAFVEDDNSIRVWGAFRNTITSQIGAVLMAILSRGSVQSDGSVRAAPLNGHVLFKSACRVCNRPLTCPESIRTGIGPVCAGRS